MAGKEAIEGRKGRPYHKSLKTRSYVFVTWDCFVVVVGSRQSLIS